MHHGQLVDSRGLVLVLWCVASCCWGYLAFCRCYICRRLCNYRAVIVVVIVVRVVSHVTVVVVIVDLLSLLLLLFLLFLLSSSLGVDTLMSFHFFIIHHFVSCCCWFHCSSC